MVGSAGVRFFVHAAVHLPSLCALDASVRVRCQCLPLPNASPFLMPPPSLPPSCSLPPPFPSLPPTRWVHRHPALPVVRYLNGRTDLAVPWVFTAKTHVPRARKQEGGGDFLLMRVQVREGWGREARGSHPRLAVGPYHVPDSAVPSLH